MSTTIEKKETRVRKQRTPERDPISQLIAEIQILKQQVEELRGTTTLLKAKKESRKGMPRDNVKYVVLGIPTRNYRPQAIACMKILANAPDPSNISEAEAMRLIEENSRLLNTSQLPWRIFQYYRAELIGGDYLKML